MIDVSVIMPVYNGEAFLDRSITSVLRQTFTEFELVIVNDGSDDRTREIIDNYALNDSRIRAIHKKREGIVRTRIEGVARSVGRYIAFIDADDWWDEDFLAAYMSEMLTEDADIVTGGCIIEEESGQSVERYDAIAPSNYGPENKEQIIAQMFYHSGFFNFGILPYLWNKLFKKDMLLEAYNGIDENISDGDDVAVLEPYLLMAENIRVTSIAKYHYVKHENQMTDTKGEDFYENVSRLYLNLKERMNRLADKEVFLSQLDQYMRLMIGLKKMKITVDNGEESLLASYLDMLSGKNEIVVVGAGHYGRRLLTKIRDRDLKNVKCFADNNTDRLQAEVNGIKVLSVDKAVESFPDAYFIISPQNGRMALIRQLSGLNVSIDQIDVFESEKFGI